MLTTIKKSYIIVLIAFAFFGCEDNRSSNKKNTPNNPPVVISDTDQAYRDLLYSMQQDLKALREESKTQANNLQKLTADIQKDKKNLSNNLDQVINRIDGLHKRVEDISDEHSGKQE